MTAPDLQMLTLDEIAYLIAHEAVYGPVLAPPFFEALRAAWRARMAVEDYIRHQFGHLWDGAHVHNHPAYIMLPENDTPTGGMP